MNDIFISYRRDDSAGHAGRLFDRLTAQLGAEHVFMDVTDLRPGQDFAVELERAVARADCVLAVIGPRWLEAADAAGRRRIDAADDFVRREIAAGLAHGATVIPVLVHGAAMPRAEHLPEALRPLARRQAIVLSDGRWDSDLQELVRFLSAGGAGAVAPAQGGRRWLVVVALIVLATVLAIGVGAWWLSAKPSGRDTPTASAPARAVAPPAIATPTPRARFAIALPPLSEVRFRTNRAQVVFTILAIRQEPRDAGSQVVSVLVRMLNRGPADEVFGSDQFRLVAGDQTIAPTTTLIGGIDTTEAKEAALSFVVPAALDAVALEVRMYAESTRLPIALSARTPIPNDAALDDFGRRPPARVVDTLRAFPAALAAGQVVEVGKASYRIAAAVIERETAETASLAVTVRCTAARGSGGVSFGSGTVRLWVDGVPRAPVNRANLAVDSGDTREVVFVFALERMPEALDVGILNGAESARVPLSLGSLPEASASRVKR